MRSKQIVDILYEFHANADITLEDLAEMISEGTPSVVRCRDCKWYYPPFEIKGRRIEGECGFHAWYRADPNENDFCSRGERKDV